MTALAVDGGQPVRGELLPYGAHWVDEDDVTSVVEALRSGWLTTGPRVAKLEERFAAFVGAREAVALSSGTAALHAMTWVLDLCPGDEVIVPALTFAATANCVLYCGARPVFADVDPDTLLLDPASVEARITSRTRAVIAVDYAGQPCDYRALRAVCERHGLVLLADACHAVGASDRGRKVGTLASLNAFSLHPVKHFTGGEGGLVTTQDVRLATRMRQFRNHGITSDHFLREQQGTWAYEMTALGYNYRLTDIQCALACSQLSKVEAWVRRRQDIARAYDAALRALEEVRPLQTRPDVSHAYHLYVVQLDLSRLGVDRAVIFRELRSEGIGTGVHYLPVYLHPYYREQLGTQPGLCPVAEAAYERILSLPIFPRMTDGDVEDVVGGLVKVLRSHVG